MESSIVRISSRGASPTPVSSEKSRKIEKGKSADELIIAQLSGSEPAAEVGVSFSEPGKAISLSAGEIVRRINEQIGLEIPGGAEALSPEEATPDATAQRIVSGIAMMFDPFMKQNKGEPEEVLERFMAAARKGIDQGYSEAFEILQGLGAFGFEGVQEGVENTKISIEAKMVAFENQKRKELGLDQKVG